MTDFLKVLLNIRSLRAVARDLTLEQLEEGLAKLTAIVEERRNSEAEDRKSREERERKISEYMNSPADINMSLEEFIGFRTEVHSLLNQVANKAHA